MKLDILGSPKTHFWGPNFVNFWGGRTPQNLTKFGGPDPSQKPKKLHFFNGFLEGRLLFLPPQKVRFFVAKESAI